MMKPCICGSQQEPRIIEADSYSAEYIITCDNCNRSVATLDDPTEALRMWNAVMGERLEKE